MVVTVPPEVEKKLIELAAQRRVDPGSLVASLIEKELENESAFADFSGADQYNNENGEFDPEALNQAVAALLNRTPEQKRAARDWVKTTCGLQP